jgi:hypothetical protein
VADRGPAHRPRNSRAPCAGSKKPPETHRLWTTRAGAWPRTGTPAVLLPKGEAQAHSHRRRGVFSGPAQPLRKPYAGGRGVCGRHAAVWRPTLLSERRCIALHYCCRMQLPYSMVAMRSARHADGFERGMATIRIPKWGSGAVSACDLPARRRRRKWGATTVAADGGSRTETESPPLHRLTCP